VIGDDVVDLGDPETRPGATHPGFDARVFAPTELAALALSVDSTRLRWTLWAAKEAAYKAAKRCDPRTVFSPRRFVVTWRGGTSGSVAHGIDRYHLTIDADPERVHAIARTLASASRGSARLVTAVSRRSTASAASPTAPSAAARALVVEQIAALLEIAPTRLLVECDGRLPRLMAITSAPAVEARRCGNVVAHDGRSSRDGDDLREITAALSLSHHGRFVSYACLLDVATEAAERAA
jgi:phosphopantetheinyl transferase (holo-ACP synthase)